MQERNMFKSCWIHGCPLTPDLPTAHLFQCSKPKAGLVPVYLVHRYRRTIYRDARRRKWGNAVLGKCAKSVAGTPSMGMGDGDGWLRTIHIIHNLGCLTGRVRSWCCGWRRVCCPVEFVKEMCFRMMPLQGFPSFFLCFDFPGEKDDLWLHEAVGVGAEQAYCWWKIWHQPRTQKNPRKGYTFAQCHSIIPHLYDQNKKMEEGPMIARTSSFTTVNGTILSLTVNAMCLPPGNLPAWRCWGRPEKSNHPFKPFPSTLSQSPPFFSFEHFRRPCIFLWENIISSTPPPTLTQISPPPPQPKPPKQNIHLPPWAGEPPPPISRLPRLPQRAPPRLSRPVFGGTV